MPTESAIARLREIYSRASVIQHSGTQTTINAFTDQTEPVDPELLEAVGHVIAERLNDIKYEVIVGEEDKGAHVATAAALAARKGLVLARWYTYPIEQVCHTSVVTDVVSEYFGGRLVINGIVSNRKYAIVDDTLSTGGTMVSLIRSIRKGGGEVAAALTIVEKVKFGGRERVKAETGIDVVSLFGIEIHDGVVIPL